jgi:hypothetical protein
MAVIEGGYLIPSEVTEGILDFFDKKYFSKTDYNELVLIRRGTVVVDFKIRNNNTELTLAYWGFPTKKIFITEDMAKEIKTDKNYREYIAEKYIALVRNSEKLG